MNHRLAAEEIDEAFCALCEETAFLLLDPSCGPTPPPDSPALAATVAISGAMNGTITIAASLELCCTIASDMLAMDPAEIDHTTAAAALGELTNIAAGVLVGRRTDCHGVCEFSPPNGASLSEAEWEHLASNANTRGFCADEGGALLALSLET
ncbi:MAG: chemotaxis protein CheX [Planctomycetota bacterium]|jgi:hypothetical protein|nr:chemotaxis protein CheX [Planctomycetota bacterium]